MPEALRMSGTISSLLVPHESTAREPGVQLALWVRNEMGSELLLSTSITPWVQRPSPAHILSPQWAWELHS